MNFEELLETRDVRKTTKMRLPYGFFYKRLIDGKYSNFVEFHDEVADHVAFSNCVRTEAEQMAKISNKHQLKFTANEGEDGVYAIAVEVGNYMTFDQFINENPAIVAKKNFINETISDLVELTEMLNEKQIYHLCYAPSNVLVRKNDGTVRLLCHGSFYARLDAEVLFEGVEDLVAPEVFVEGSTIDARADVYSLAKFVDWLYHSAGLPFELKHVLAKATDVNPDERLPSPEVVEYVKPVEEPIPDDMLDDEQLLLDIGADADSATIAKAVARQQAIKDSISVDEKRMREYQAKAEQIFRKQFTKAAEQILSKVYNRDKMNLSENEFMVRSRAMTEELAKKELELAKEANLTGGRSQQIASEIVDQITNRKMKELDKDSNKDNNKKK